jgi:hypothetical protein
LEIGQLLGGLLGDRRLTGFRGSDLKINQEFAGAMGVRGAGEVGTALIHDPTEAIAVDFGIKLLGFTVGIGILQTGLGWNGG